MRHRLETGITLVEILIGLALFGILMAMGVPSFSRWIQSSQIRNSAEAIQNGLTLARAEAVRRNTNVRFQLVSSVTNACALSDAGRNWIISLNDPTGSCDSAPSDSVAPRIIQTRSSGEGSPNAVINANGIFLITFNGTGQSNTAASIDITNPSGGNCSANEMRCLRVTVSTGGQIRMCDPARANTDPQGC